MSMMKGAAMISLCSRESAASPPCIHGYCPGQCLGELAGHKHESASAATTTTAMAFRENFAQRTKSAILPNTHFTDHESLPSLADAFSGFADAYPQYRDTHSADRLRESEYSHLARHVCLDYTGLSLFSHAQLQQQHSSPSSSQQQQQQLLQPPFFNISYKSSSSLASHVQYGEAGGIESAMRNRIMRFLNISEDDYTMVLAANKTAAFRLLAEAYPFQSNKRLLTVYEYESEAADAMADCAAKRGAAVTSASFSWPSLRIDSAKLKRMLSSSKKNKKKNGGLLVFPLQSSVTGVRHPYFWMRLAQENGWHVLLDACALGPKDTDTLGLSLIQPDFMVCSFFKLVGENPSGFAAVFVKKSSGAVLEASGTAAGAGIVSIVPARRASNQLDDDFSGTPSEWEAASSSLSGPTASTCEQHKNDGTDEAVVVCGGLDHADSLGLVAISCRLRCLSNWLVSALMKLQHPYSSSSEEEEGEGRSLVRIYGPRVKFDRGPALAFNVFDWRGGKVEPVLVQKLADRSDISLGCGFLRNVCLRREEKQGSGGRGAGGSGIGVVSASLSFVSNFEDAYRLWSFVARFLDADFVEKERWRYVALNQKMVEV